jgi:hypothetical protein
VTAKGRQMGLVRSSSILQPPYIMSGASVKTADSPAFGASAVMARVVSCMAGSGWARVSANCRSSPSSGQWR